MNEENGAKGGVAAAWLVVFLLALSTGVENGLIVLIGYGGQWLKSMQKFPTVLAQLLLLLLCGGVYALLHKPAVVPPDETWIKAAATWSLAALGVTSIAAGTRGAPKTDSL